MHLSIILDNQSKMLTKAERLPSYSHHPPELTGRAGEQKIRRESRKRQTHNFCCDLSELTKHFNSRLRQLLCLTVAVPLCPSPMKCIHQLMRMKRIWCIPCSGAHWRPLQDCRRYCIKTNILLSENGHVFFSTVTCIPTVHFISILLDFLEPWFCFRTIFVH